jgi:hypothetical protein
MAKHGILAPHFADLVSERRTGAVYAPAASIGRSKTSTVLGHFLEILVWNFEFHTSFSKGLLPTPPLAPPQIVRWNVRGAVQSRGPYGPDAWRDPGSVSEGLCTFCETG